MRKAAKNGPSYFQLHPLSMPLPPGVYTSLFVIVIFTCLVCSTKRKNSASTLSSRATFISLMPTLRISKLANISSKIKVGLAGPTLSLYVPAAPALYSTLVRGDCSHFSLNLCSTQVKGKPQNSSFSLTELFASSST